MIAVLPDDAWQRIQSGQHPLVTVTFDKLEPVRANYLTYYAYVGVNELNRRVLISVLDQASAQNPRVAGPPLQGYAQQMQTDANQFSNQVRQRDATGAADTLAQMETLTTQNQSDLKARAQLFGGAQQYFNAPASARDDFHTQAAAVDQSLSNVQITLNNLSTSLPLALAISQPDAQAIADLATNSQKAESAAQALQLPPSDVLVSPYQAEINNQAPILPSFIAFYAPAVLALLLQHVSITLTALTLVRERTSGATELFRVTPMATPEIVFGKFLGYAIVAGLTARCSPPRCGSPSMCRCSAAT